MWEGSIAHVVVGASHYPWVNNIVWWIYLLFHLGGGGCDIVLGVQWLSSVSPVMWDFQQLTFEFNQANIHYKLVHHSPHASTIQEVSL